MVSNLNGRKEIYEVGKHRHSRPARGADSQFLSIIQAQCPPIQQGSSISRARSNATQRDPIRRPHRGEVLISGFMFLELIFGCFPHGRDAP